MSKFCHKTKLFKTMFLAFSNYEELVLQEEKETLEQECLRNKTNLQTFEKQIILMYLIL